MRKLIVAVTFSLLLAFSVFAKNKSNTSEIASSDSAMPAAKASGQKVVFKKSEKHEFSGTKLKGRLKKPELSYIYERKGLRQEQIVNVPSHFNDEIVKGAGQF